VQIAHAVAVVLVEPFLILGIASTARQLHLLSKSSVGDQETCEKAALELEMPV